MFNTITSIALILISIGVMVVYIAPEFQEISSLRAKSVELSDAITKAKDIENVSRELSEKMRSFPKNDIDRLNRFLPQTLDELRFINNIQGIATRNSTTIKDISVEEKPADSGNEGTPQGKFVTHMFSLTVSANYEVFISFLKDLERNVQFIDFTSVALSGGAPGGTKGSQGEYSYNVKFKTYSLN